MYEIDKIKNTILNGDVLEQLKRIPDNSINMCITSPPYWAMRDYCEDMQIGLEYSSNEFVGKLATIFKEVNRVLKNDGTCWINIRDTYSKGYSKSGVKSKSLCMIPERLCINMLDDGWILRNDIIWHKPNAMPDSCKNRFTVDYEHLYFFSKSYPYKFNTQYEPFVSSPQDLDAKSTVKRKKEEKKKITKQDVLLDSKMVRHGAEGSTLSDPSKWSKNGRIKRTTWSINTKPCKEAHFAVFPEELITVPILAGTDNGDVVLDIFMGSGTTGVVAKKLKRNYIGIEINKEYIEIAKKRIEDSN